MDPLEVRELRYFIAVAEELHFGRAAERLGIAQPPLSRAIQRIERRLGVTLLERSSRSVQLTPAGETLLREGRTALAAMARAVRSARRAGEPEPRLVVAMKAAGDGGLLPDLLATYRAQHADVHVDVHICGAGEQASLLRDGRADVAFMHSPQQDFAGLDTMDLLVEHPVVVLPRHHRLAGRDRLSMADLSSETMPIWRGAQPTDAVGPQVHDTGQLAQLITWGHVVALLPESVRDHLPRSLVCVPVLDAPTTTLMLAWPAGSRSPQLAAFVHAAITAARRPTSGTQPNAARLGCEPPLAP
ncbi:LysR substrate-binding domain-containing protein [Streptosporangium sp. NPDC001681]|uniref:LysR family transcriptional regulator n=1 Tax=Streptosporangium sp. NPDC001681 TaxID=3154395 RepID=UPI00331D06CC